VIVIGRRLSPDRFEVLEVAERAPKLRDLGDLTALEVLWRPASTVREPRAVDVLEVRRVCVGRKGRDYIAMPPPIGPSCETPLTPSVLWHPCALCGGVLRPGYVCTGAEHVPGAP